MVNKKYYWLRLKENFFKQKEIKKLRKIAGGDTYTVIYLKLQLLSMKTDGKLLFEGIEDTFADEIALELDEEVSNVEMTLAFLQKHNLIIEIEEDEFLIPETLECIGSEGASAERVRRCRTKKKLTEISNQKSILLQCNTDETKCNTEIEIESEKKIEKEKEKYSSSSSDEEELKGSLLEIMRFCQKLDFKLKKVHVLDFIRIYGVQKVKQALITVSHANTEIKSPNSYLAAVLNDMSRDKKVDVNINSKSMTNKFTDYEQRPDMTKEEEDKVLGWD